jgi:DNA-binding response OmpR family regulator
MTITPRKLLCVEDEPMLLEDLAIELRDGGYHVTEQADGMTALSVALTDKFDLIISDMRLPKLGGIEMLTEIRRGGGPNAGTPFVMLTAFDDAVLRRECAELGNVSYLVKPVDYASLLALLQQIFSSCIDAEVGGNAFSVSVNETADKAAKRV